MALISFGALFLGGTATGQSSVPEPTVTNTHFDRPPNTIHKTKKFVPEDKPTPSEVIDIANSEQKLWGGPSIIGRMQCESGLRWNAVNGPYRGLLQIGPWWDYAYPQTPKKVVYKTHKTDKQKVYLVTEYSNNTQTKVVDHYAKVKIKIKHVGHLPDNASPYNGTASIVVGQRAVSGDGPTTAWSCPL